ncbi:hypothetical protein Pse7367_3068 [Thalassoporum mexicanum PCC 7367]|uniref:hypothetical protein n=1 Tax=Thalassoporum mexicanum TaxID=3457544 RepID=UPI00029FB0D6|nr:hypothetical protein [Pseudanabaena sp. PCC 7367]AFY71317.1 hypothetical protein Pse7367_3068 [Pseudanabaena sp. PCC 7367]
MSRETPKQWSSSPTTTSAIIFHQLGVWLALMVNAIQKIPAWLLICGGLLALLVWNWQLVIATLAGMAIMGIAYLAQDWDWQHFWFGLQRSVDVPTQKFTVAAAAGVSTVLLAYTTLAIWSGVENHWLALAFVLQLIATLSVLALVTKQGLNNWLTQERDSIERFVYMLAAPDHLERLIAVRQLAEAVQQNRFSLSQERAIAEYCQVLLERETVPSVRDAALETLDLLNYTTCQPNSNGTSGDRKIPCNMPEPLPTNSREAETQIDRRGLHVQMHTPTQVDRPS